MSSTPSCHHCMQTCHNTYPTICTGKHAGRDMGIVTYSAVVPLLKFGLIMPRGPAPFFGFAHAAGEYDRLVCVATKEGTVAAKAESTTHGYHLARGDRILNVNGYRGVRNMRQQLHAEHTVHMTVCRYPPVAHVRMVKKWKGEAFGIDVVTGHGGVAIITAVHDRSIASEWNLRCCRDDKVHQTLGRGLRMWPLDGADPGALHAALRQKDHVAFAMQWPPVEVLLAEHLKGLFSDAPSSIATHFSASSASLEENGHIVRQ
eukprot:GEMP01025876.1.p1 GENE.GEMP01025876.1~~GEMP01025876.1.p1  ORF type:complete len:260 (+),score=67.67 GEMP01025876.1:222-1001(+)